MFDFDWRVLGSIALTLVIVYFAFVPFKGKRTEFFRQQKRNKRLEDHNKARPKTYTALTVLGITARRGDSVTLIIADFSKVILTFNGIAQGNYSETIYLVVTGDGGVKQHTNEVLARSDYTKGDYGIVAVTMAPGAITQRSIVPDTVHKDNAFDLEFSVRVSA